MATSRQALESTRRTPRQERAARTVEAIHEAAAQILERGGLAAFTTNAVAERAGVGIGTLYQYYRDKNALLLEIVRREAATTMAAVAAALREAPGENPEDKVRAVIRTIVHAFGGRPRARKALIQAAFAQGLGEEFLAPLVALTDALAGRMRPAGPPASREQAFVLSRAVLGAIRAAVLEEAPFFKSRAFEDELVRLAMAYLRAVATA